MNIQNSDIKDIPKIFELYRIATKYMKSKNQVAWPEFPRELIELEIEEKRQWKIQIDGVTACIWATTLNDELIWGDNDDKAVYIHRIATDPNFRGRNFVHHIVDWAKCYCRDHSLDFIRMDTVGLNTGLISHYAKFGFELIETRTLENTDELPAHYKEGPVCLFEIKC